MAKLAWVLLVASACAAAQTVEGTVVNQATGNGIAGASVTLQQGGYNVYSATTDAQGYFRIESVKDGAYSARYTAPGYIPPGRPLGSPLFQVTAGAPAHLQGSLIPVGRISARVIDGRGDAVGNASVELFSSQVFFVMRSDAKGKVAQDSVFPGATYTLAAAAPPGWKPPDPDPETGQPRGWIRTYYPGVARPEQAAQLVLPAGGELRDLEIKLLAAQVHTIRGMLVGPDGAAAPKVAIALGQSGVGQSREAAYHAETKADGAFEIAGVADGEWRLSAEWESGGVKLRGAQWIEMAGREVEGLKLRLSPPFAVEGKVILETRQGMPAPRPPSIIVIGAHGGGVAGFPDDPRAVRPDAAGRFRVEDVYPGAYWIDLAGEPPLFYLDDIRLGEAPALSVVELSAGAPEVTIVYKSNGGTVRGTVEKCGGGWVWLIPQDTAMRRRPGSPSRGACDAHDAFEIAAVKPGEYYALAFSAEESLPGFWPNLEDAFLQSATRITVRAGETTQAELRLSGGR